MHEILQFFKSKFTWHPLKTAFLVATIGISTTMLIASLGVSSRLSEMIRNVSRNGTTIISVVNAKKNEDGSYTYQIPPKLKAEQKRVLLDEIPEITIAAIVTQVMPWERIVVDGKAYRPSRPIGSDEQILDVMGLPILYGSVFTELDIKNKSNVLMISETAAQSLWGEPANAVGKTIQVNRISRFPQQQQRANNQFQMPEVTIDTFTVVGVFRTPNEIEREAYGASDFIVPYTSQLPQGQAARFSGISAIMIRTTMQSAEKAGAKVQTHLASGSTDDLWISAWRGGVSQRDAAYLETASDTVKRFSAITNGLSFFIVLVSVIGILSALLVEVMDQRKSLGIMRTVGLSSQGVVRRFILYGLLYGLMGVVTGSVLAVVAGPLMTNALVPLLDMLNLPVRYIASIITLRALLAGSAAVMGLSLLSTIAPAVMASNMEIISTIKEA